MAERLRLAANLTRDILQDNPSLAPGGSGQSGSTSGKKTMKKPAVAKAGSRKPKSKSVLTSTRGRGIKHRLVDSESEVEEEVAVPSKQRLPLSKRLPKSEWPSGYTSDDVDSFTVTDLLRL